MPSYRILHIAIILLLPIICGAARPESPAAAALATGVTVSPPPASTTQNSPPTGCLACHPYELDSHNQLSCVWCHAGNNQATTREVAHIGLTAAPAAPDRLQSSQGNLS